MIYPIIGILAVALAAAASVWWMRRVRDRAYRAPRVTHLRDRTSHRLDRIRRAGL